MTGVRTYALSPSVMATALMGKGSTKVSVCIPCRNEAATIGPIVSQIVSALMSGDVPMVDELLVFDDGSTDATASVAAAAGARVIRVSDVLAEAGPGSGKGNVLWASVAASDGDVKVAVVPYNIGSAVPPIGGGQIIPRAGAAAGTAGDQGVPKPIAGTRGRGLPCSRAVVAGLSTHGNPARRLL